jgi:hypothetical protein
MSSIIERISDLWFSKRAWCINHKLGGQIMKNFLRIIVLTMTLICSMGTANAQNNGLGGLLLGMGSGALVGHAIGGNADGAVVGTVIGGTIGMLIGSEMDRTPAVQTRAVYRQREYPPQGYWHQQTRPVIIGRTRYVPQPRFIFMGGYNSAPRSWQGRGGAPRHERYGRQNRNGHHWR